MDKYLICEESRKAKRPVLKSSDVVVTPLISPEMVKLIDHQTDEASKALYMNMLDRASKDPENGIWYTCWDIALKHDEKQSIGVVYFDGPAEYGIVKLSFACENRYKWERVIADALRLVSEWALVQDGVYEIDTYIPTSEDGYIRNAERADFIYREEVDGIEFYSKEKPPSSWMGLYLFIGLIAGFIVGYVFSSMIIGMAVSVIAGILVGGILDQKETVARENVTGQKRQSRRVIAKKRKEAAALRAAKEKKEESEE